MDRNQQEAVAQAMYEARAKNMGFGMAWHQLSPETREEWIVAAEAAVKEYERIREV